MPLASGTRLGPYEITAPLGSGGMGEAYRARDTKLGRDVAIKVLPTPFASDPRKSQLAELRFFGGLSLEEAGETLGISVATAERDWQAARARLLKELRGE